MGDDKTASEILAFNIPGGPNLCNLCPAIESSSIHFFELWAFGGFKELGCWYEVNHFE